MSEPIPESIPTSADPRSKRPVKKRALTPRAHLAADVEALFAKPDRDIRIPGAESKKSLAPPPEIVANVQGSSAGAGSGEFHVYKASRRREYERLRLMDEEVKKEEDEEAFQERKAELERKDREKTEKNRARREKQRARKMKQKKGQKGDSGGSDKEGTPAPDGGRAKRKLAPNANAPQAAEDEDDQVLNGGGEVKNADESGLVIEDDD
ncbi:DUF1168-domain-containing protein [Trematosphaeria pertusa]|uniref:DUF1168-domain-containing protein n=1 Tax=Trematosphaeria pertusa TaxID=390896 RepID=A0A6A6IHA7_9PLEO|nr:DUF1168-domain-containing protein [Trematosphaeria pertusa]KAF2249811.1 DUF1168-domain-containing protein [Trematosphaeria pertusa]